MIRTRLRLGRRGRWQQLLILLPFLYFALFHLRPAIYHSLFSGGISRRNATPHDLFPLPQSRLNSLSTDLVIASVAADDVSWTDKLKDHIPNLNIVRYVSDSKTAPYHPPVPKGREALMYFTYLYENYDKLPDISIFIHAEESPWHIDAALRQSMTFALTHLDLEQVQKRDYFNLRVSWKDGCPAYINTTKSLEESDPNTEEPYMALAFRENFGEHARVPEILAGPCCSQFAVTKKAIRSVPREQYRHHMTWLMESTWPDQLTGRTWEHMWPWLFKNAAIDCEVEWRSICQMYGVCFPGAPGFLWHSELWEEREALHDQLGFWRELWNPALVRNSRNRVVEVSALLDKQLQAALKNSRDQKWRKASIGH
jgi:hypothetical protein